MITFLTLLFLKHYIVDFVLQTDTMIAGKGKYGNMDGMCHSMQHAVGTLIVSTMLIQQEIYWVMLPLFDFVVHYHVDYIKSRFGCKDPSRKEFWNQLGLDQLVHYLTYITMVLL